MPAVLARTAADEESRLAALRAYGILDSTAEERFDRITRLAARLFEVPISLVSFVDRDRQWCKSRHGLAAHETPRELAFCTHAILEDGVFLVPDTHADARFAGNPLVTGEPQVRFYAGAPLCMPEGHKLGTLCLIDRHPRGDFSEDKQRLLQDLASMVVDEILDMTEQKIQETTLKEARDQAERANRSKSLFLAMMSHEIRTPMNGVLGTLGLLANTALDERQRSLVTTARTSGEGLLAILNDVLDFSKMEAGKLDLEEVAFDPRSLLAHVADLWRPHAEAKGLDFRLEVAPDVPRSVAGDPGRLRQMLLNFVSNAVKFTETGSIRVDLKLDDARPTAVSDGTIWLRFAVADTGIGIPRDRAGQVFTEFDQLDRATATLISGTGLGLAITKRLAQMMQGEIGFDSRENVGSTFWFAVPLLVSEQELAEGESVAVLEDLSLASAGPPPRILIAEDNSTNQLVARLMLESMGCQVDIAADGLEAIDAVSKRPYSAVLMDISMPELDGLEATRRIRAARGPESEIPIIALTANAMREDYETYIANGMNDCVTKPIMREQLHGTLQRILDHSPVNGAASDTAAAAADEGADGPPLIDDEVLVALAAAVGPETMPMLAQRFLSDMEGNLSEIETAAGSGDVDAVSRRSHTIQSVSGTFGALRLQQQAQEIEKACREGRTEDAMEMVSLLCSTGKSTLDSFRKTGPSRT